MEIPAVHEKKHEKVIYYKCKCNGKIHHLTWGQRGKNISIDMININKMKCKDRDSIIKVQKKELWIITDNKIKKELI